MRLLFQVASKRHLFTWHLFARVNNRVAAHLPGIQFLVTNTVKEIDMTLKKLTCPFYMLLWYGLRRVEATQPAPPSPPILHPFFSWPARQLVELQGQAGSGSTRPSFIPNTAFAFPVPPLPGASGIPAAHSGSILQASSAQSFELGFHFSQPASIQVPCTCEILLIYRVSDFKEFALKRDKSGNNKSE